ncbi:MAG: NAD-dependent epimerase/dehydratase family protein [bacterium]|nr:NAD-dependent epimerase/dehydratase family protein [bacterium]
MSLSICVTGGAGFIGSHVADACIAEGHRVVIVDDLSSGSKRNVPTQAQLEVCDIRSDHAATLMADGGFDLLIHHAAQMDVRRSVADPSFDADVNICGLINLVENGCRGKLQQVIFSSTGGAIYGEQDYFPADEQHPTRPVSPYGVSKLASEHYLEYFAHHYGIAATCLRYANVYGPRQNPHGEAGVVAIFINRLLAGEVPTINGDGCQTRDYVFVRDIVRANLAAIGRSGFQTFNVGTGVETDVNVLYGNILTVMNGGPDALHGEAQPGEQLRSVISSALLESELGVRPNTEFIDGLRDTVTWFRQQAHEQI